MQVTNEMLSVLDQSAGPTGLVEFLEITQPKWPYPLRYVVNSSQAINVFHENGSQVTYAPAPITISRSSEENTLDQELGFTLGDLGEAVPQLIDLFIHDEVIELPLVSYRAYLVGQYNTPVWVARNLELESVTRDWKGTQGESRAPGLNDNGNGDLYSASTDKSLIGFY